VTTPAEAQRVNELIAKLLDSEARCLPGDSLDAAMSVLASFPGEKYAEKMLWQSERKKAIESGEMDPTVALIAAVVVGVAALLDEQALEKGGLQRWFRVCQFIYALRGGPNLGGDLRRRRTMKRAANFAILDALIRSKDDRSVSAGELAGRLKPLLPAEVKFGVRAIATRITALRTAAHSPHLRKSSKSPRGRRAP
jgi:hypothetical protein